MHFSNVVFLGFNKVIVSLWSDDPNIRVFLTYPEPLISLSTTTSPSLTEKVTPDIAS